MKNSKQHPRMVMIIRHGEKPGNPDDEKGGGPHLSILGSARAAALPSLFTPAPNGSTVKGLHPIATDLSVGSKQVHFTGTYSSTTTEASQPRFPIPDFLFATKPDDGSHRPVETITPLMQALQCLNDSKIGIKHKFANTSKGIEGLASEILGNPVYADKVILICWHHGKIPQLVEALGGSLDELPCSKWPPAIFDLILCITWKEGKANLAIDTQQLLYGDNECPPGFTAGSVTLVLDAPQKKMEAVDGLPKNFRSMSNCKVAGNLISGSAQYSPSQLQNMISKGFVQHPLTVVDLRQESHGFLKLKKPLNDETEVAISWFAERDWINVAKGFASLQVDEMNRLAHAAKSSNLPIYVIDTKTPIEGGICTATAYSVSPDCFYQTEQALLQANHVGYLRLPTTDRCRPRDSEVDRFIAFELTLAKDTWLHFHCRAGDGRTTTFMAMHDIFHNASVDSLDFILGRQEGLGGIDLSHPSKSSDSFEHPFEIERKEFLSSFYSYILYANDCGFTVSWSAWNLQNAMQPQRSTAKKEK